MEAGWPIRAIAFLVVLAAGTWACSAPPAEPVAADGAALLQAIERWHPDPWHDRTQDDLHNTAAAVDALADDDERLVGLMRMAVLGERDGHSGVFPLAQTDEVLRIWPLQLYDFPDGLRLVATTSDTFEPLIGARLVAVGAVDVARVVEAVAPLVPHDHDQTVRARLPQYLSVPEVLDGLGIAADDSLTFERDDGSREVVTAPAPIEPDVYAQQFGVWNPLIPPSLTSDESSELLTLQHRDEGIWSAALPDDAAVYVGWHAVLARPADSTTIAAVADDLAGLADAPEPPRIVVDVRHNPGGDNARAAPMLRALRDVEARAAGTVRVLTSRATFSAAALFVAELRAAAPSVLIVGEAAGGSAATFGDPRETRLATAGVVAHIAGRAHVRGGGELVIQPDLAVETRWQDLNSGVDAVLDAALAAPV